MAYKNTAGGSGTPGGSNTQVQFNDAGSFGGDAGFTYNKTDNNLTIQGPAGAAGGNLYFDTNGEFRNQSIQVIDQPTTDTLGGFLTIQAGLGNGTGNGGSMNIYAGEAGATGNGGTLNLTAGGGGATAGNGGSISISGGYPNGSTGNGGNVGIYGSDAAATSGDGGSVELFSGNAQGGNSNGGNIAIVAGTKTGSGTDGYVYVQDGVGNNIYMDNAEMDFGHSSKVYNFFSAGIKAIINTASVISTDKTFTFPNQTGTFSIVTSGSGAPGTTPAALGQIYVDTSGLKAYISCGTSSSSDWKIMN